MQAHKLDLRHQRSSPSLFPDLSSSAVSSVLAEPISRSIAIELSDSSFLLYPPFPAPLSASNLPPPTVIPSISTSACFLRLLRSAGPDTGQVLFLSASAQGDFVLIRGWLLPSRRGNRGEDFAPVLLGSKPDSLNLGLLLEHRHGFSVALAGSINFFVLHSPAEEKIFVYAANVSGEIGMKEFHVNLMKCAVIECTLPIYSIQLSPGFLLLGEVAGVRVFPLRPLVKGKAVKKKNPRSARKENTIDELNRDQTEFPRKKLPNGMAMELISGKKGDMGASESPLPRKIDADRSSAKLRTLKLKQNSTDSSYLFGFDHADMSPSPSPIKATSIQILPQRRFLILDSSGGLHLLSLCRPMSSESSKDLFMVKLNYPMKVQILAAFPNLETRGQIFWVSDGLYSIHVITLTDAGESDKEKTDTKLTRVSAIHAIFAGERVRHIVALSDHAVLILEEGDVYLYEFTGS